MAKQRWTLGVGPAGRGAALGALLLLAAGVLVWRARQPTVYAPDANAAPVAETEPMSPEELQTQLQARSDASAFRVRLNAQPRVRGDQAELLLENPVENGTRLSVTITLDESGETVYESGPLSPGAQVLTGTLTQTLPPGEHPATAACTAIDPETGKAVGTPVLIGIVLDAAEPEETPPAREAPPT